jgi:TonB family protein
MKKLTLIIILLTAYSVSAQTGDKEKLKQLNQNVISLYRSGKFDEALKEARQAVDLSSKVHGLESLETAAAYTNLGIILRDKKKFKEAVGNFQKSVEIYRKNETANGKALYEVYDVLAASQFLGGMEKEAETSYLKAAETAKSIFGKESKETLKPVLALAVFYAQTNKDNAEKSLDYYLESFALAIKHFGKESLEVEKIKIYKSYYSQYVHWKNDELHEKYTKKESEIFGYERGKALSLPLPRYPPEAKSLGKEGIVVVKVWINERGEVTNAQAVYGELFFAPAVEEVARKAKFKPSMMNGTPIGIVDFIAYKFVKA